VITFTYFNTELTVTAQTVEPLKLVFKSHAWYLVAWSLHKNDIRTYKMSRIRELQVTNQLFERVLPQDFSITPEYKEEYNIPIFRLHFSEKIAYKVYDFRRSTLKNWMMAPWKYRSATSSMSGRSFICFPLANMLK
jgi:predicted DNA-binding transcriptional regulator YafY